MMMNLKEMNQTDANKNNVINFCFNNNWIAKLSAIIGNIARSHSGEHQSQFDVRMTALRE